MAGPMIHFANIFCVNIGRKVKPIGCFKRWHNFAAMMLERARARTVAFMVRIFYRQIDKNSIDGNVKKCFAIRISVAKI